ncbi:MAG: ATP-binding protein, partial [Bacteroidales bacterium]|nr:ATP-binding protein [Bacteroidales bacterium]
MSRYIRALILQGEHQKQDFKFAINDSRKIARSLGAFANTKGGRLLIGVKDNGAVVGVKSDEEAYMVEAAAYFYCKPAVEFTIKSWNVDGKMVLEVDIAESNNKPHLAEKDGRWLAFVRVNDENILANTVWLNYWRLQKNSKGVFFHYSDAEKILMNCLTQNDFISIEDFIIEAKITEKEATIIIARMAALEVLDIHFFDAEFVYSLKEK